MSTTELLAVGLNFKTAPVGLRERYSFTATVVPKVLDGLRQALPGAEVLLLSTCNRTELYVAVPPPAPTGEALIRLLPGAEAMTPADLEHFYVKGRDEAVVHLFTVAASLDSMVVGEAEILGQVKQAYSLAVEAGTAGRVLMPLFQRAFLVAKRVRAETDISRGRVSVGSIAVELAERVFETLHTKTVMIVGAGEISEQTLKNLVAKEVKETLVLNRSLERGRALADKYGGTAIPFDRLDEYLPRADIIISSTGAPHCVIHTPGMRRAMAERHEQPVLLIDLAVPRDIEEEIGTLDNVYLYNIDDLQRVADENLARRQDAIASARGIVLDEARVALRLLGGSGLGQIMRQLDAAAQRIEEAELARAFAREKVAPFPVECEHCRQEIRVMMRRALNKMLANPKKALNDAARSGDQEEYMRMAKRLFGIEDEPGDHN